MRKPFSIRIFCPDGNPGGLRIISKSNWNGCGIVCPRSILPAVKSRKEFSQPGVYVLVGPKEEDVRDKIYVGEGDPVGHRLERHYAERDFWTWAVFFVSTDNSLNKAHVQHLEARLLEMAWQARRATLDNANIPQRPALSEAETADAESFLADILSIFPLLGLTVFENIVTEKSNSRHELKIEAKGIIARGYETAEGFVVIKGSTAVCSEVPSIHHYLSDLRRDLQSQGVMVPQGDHLEFTQEYLFNSPSTAAGVVQGRSANGRIDWKDKHSRTLKKIQEEKMGIQTGN
ncbi:MAG: GIY-YIG nuclease family protein [Methanotrichaceae archaeon]|nr:GIY-YIG nuclease family protein [Methanotrichaceae archaeon]